MVWRGWESEATLTLDPATGVPRELRQVMRATGAVTVVN